MSRRTSQPDNFGSNPFTDTDSQDESSAYRDDVDPGDSASAAAEYSVHHNSRTTGRPLGQHSIQLPSPPRRYYYPVAAPKPFVGSRAMSLLSSSDGYGDVSPPPPPPRRMTTFSSRSASRLTPSIAHTGPYAPPSVYAPPYGQMVPYAGQPRPFQGPSDYYQGPYYSPDYHYYPPLPTDDPPFLPIPGPIKAKRPDRDPDLLKMEADLEKLQLDRKKAELEESIHKEKELRDKRDSARRAHEPAALGAKPDQGEIGKIVMEQLKEVKSQLAQLTKSALDANQASPESPKISRRPSLKRRTFPEEQGTASYGGFERGLYEDGQDLEQLKKRFSTPRKKGGALDSKAQSKPPDKRRRVDFASAEPREQVRIRGRTAAEAPHGQTRPAMGMRTPSTMSGALPVELDPKPRIAAKLSSRSHGLEDTGIRIKFPNGERTSLPKRSKFQATVEDELPTPYSSSLPVHFPPSSKTKIGTRKKRPVPSHESPTQLVGGLEQRQQHGNNMTKRSQNQPQVKTSESINRDTHTRTLSRHPSQTINQSEFRPHGRTQDDARRMAIPMRENGKKQVVGDFDSTEASEDEAYEEDIFAKKAYKKPASAKGAIEKVVYIEDVSIEEADPASGRATTNAPPNEEESEEPVEEVLEEDTSEVMSGQPEIALESPRSHSDASQENPEASIATGTGFYDSDSLTVEEGFAARTSSTQHRTSSFPQSSGNSNRFANRASAPDNRPPKSSELVSGFDALRLERSLSGAVYKAIVDAFQKNALSLLQIARPQVAVGETQRPLNQHPFDTAYLPPEHKASVESVVTMQNINGRHETLHGGRNPMPSGATGDHNHPHVLEDATYDFSISRGLYDKGSQTNQKFHTLQPSNLTSSQHKSFSTTKQTDTTRAASGVAGARVSGRPQQSRGTSVARHEGNELDDELAGNPWLFDLGDAEDTLSDSDSERSFRTAPTPSSRRGSFANWDDSDPHMRGLKRLNPTKQLEANRDDYSTSQQTLRYDERWLRPEESQIDESLSGSEGRPVSAPSPPEYYSSQEDDYYFGHQSDHSLSSISPSLMVPVADRCFVIPLRNFTSNRTVPDHRQSRPHEARKQRPRSTWRNRTYVSGRATSRMPKVDAHTQRRSVYRGDDSQTALDESEGWVEL